MTVPLLPCRQRVPAHDVHGEAYHTLRTCNSLHVHRGQVERPPPLTVHARPLPWHDPFSPLFRAWLDKEGSWEGKLRADVGAVAQHLKEAGATKLGCIGFCWGVSAALRAGQVRAAGCWG